jgi:2-polyprenyl-6-methoxyphenol hydroxylase-like FAD-dependent oxidoreductase
VNLILYNHARYQQTGADVVGVNTDSAPPHRHPRHTRRLSAEPILVVGAGIGGLTAAIALRRAGLPVEVYERAPELLEVGAGLTLQPNALLALRAIGMEDAVRLAGHAQAASRLLRSDGRVLAEVPVQDVYRAVGAIAVGIHRGTLQSLLLDALGPVTPRCGRTAVGYEEESDRVTVHFAEGESATGALLLGADGLRSAVRAQLLADGEPVYRGYTAWRGVAPPGATLLAASAESWGCGRRFGMVPIDGGRAYWYAAVNAPPGGTEISRAVLRALFAGWHASVHTLVEATPEEAILRGDVFDRPPSSIWGRGRVTLLGDAAHPMTPNLGQGACQAIEDAVVLARCLAERCDPAALRRYEARRRRRANQVVVSARRLGAIAQWEGKLLCRLRDAAFATVPASSMRRSLTASWTFEAQSCS